MLDDASLSDKLGVARLWFNRAMAGEMPFTARTAKRFGELLGQCEHEAAMAAARLDIAHATVALLEGQRTLATLDTTEPLTREQRSEAVQREGSDA